MRRSMISVLVAMAFSHAMAADNHPLEKAVQSIAKVATDLETAQRGQPAGSNAELTSAIEGLRVQASQLWKSSVLAPLAISDSDLKKMGFEFELTNHAAGYYRLKTNEAKRALDQGAYDLKTDKWLELSKLAKSQGALIEQTHRLTTEPLFNSGIATRVKESAAIVASLNRIELLKRLSERVDLTLGCIAYFGKAFRESGLFPQERPYGEQAWSSVDLERVYQVRDIAKLSSTQRVQAKARLAELVKRAGDFEETCISIDRAAFMASELEKL